ncbi:hypothetical protein OVA24_06775 [Luteolibacter sp. SL250]|uniref:hypothetical protein n=1 Tax=Luteolibacter sp. SL250 TaxID=2995170 RepID=UPI002270E427|nr:hypothetical protein [Luteolibacter sp. SL250]WAC21085.1 hypothetical protein OVA24_06775 [Luteolibacter sp. SL250]
MKESEQSYSTAMVRSSASRLMAIVMVLCATLCLISPCEAAGGPNGTIPAQTHLPATYLAAKFKFLDDLFTAGGRAGGKAYGYSSREAQREERRGERGFFYYVFQTLLRLTSGVFLAYHAGTLIEKINRKNQGLDTAVAIGGFVFSLIFPWWGFLIGGICWGLWKLSDESAKNPPASDQ